MSSVLVSPSFFSNSPYDLASSSALSNFSGNQSGLEDTTSDALDGDVFAGGVDGVYINPNITACAITIDS